MSTDAIPVSMVTVAGRFRDNRRGMLHIKAQGEGLANLVIDQPPAFGMAGQRTTIALADDNGKIGDVVARLRALADALEAVTDVSEWRAHEYDPPEQARPYWWQDYDPAMVEGVSA